ncbi:MAG TPA: hypothetical protein P5056_03275 [Candidatus Paceibacterota bacterium]|nr:hypothetical protein [Candidatus Paceibacterota bacterium]
MSFEILIAHKRELEARLTRLTKELEKKDAQAAEDLLKIAVLQEENAKLQAEVAKYKATSVPFHE